MSDTVRCPACRGAKKMPKLGGMTGECNTCIGKGTILASDKPKPIVVEIEAGVTDMIKSVADCVPASTTTVTSETIASYDVKIDGKKALYKRKKSA